MLNSEEAIGITTMERNVVSRYRRSQGTRKGNEGEHYQNTLYTYRKLSKLTKWAKKKKHH